MLGARMGCFYTVLENHNNKLYMVRDLDSMLEYFKGVVDRDDIDCQLTMFGNSLRQQLDMPVAELTRIKASSTGSLSPTQEQGSAGS